MTIKISYYILLSIAIAIQNIWRKLALVSWNILNIIIIYIKIRLRLITILIIIKIQLLAIK